MLFLIGIFTILIGFLLIITGIALSMFQDSNSRQDHSKKMDAFGRETRFENTPDSDWSSHKKPPGKVESKIKAGGVIMLGPIPIIFGSDNESAKTVAILAIILMLLSLLIFKGSFF
jgi:uncharacterized protein (TIGR00304 family)